jgi:hypothetical protein
MESEIAFSAIWRYPRQYPVAMFEAIFRVGGKTA